jgi:hypothetical protein
MNSNIGPGRPKENSTMGSTISFYRTLQYGFRKNDSSRFQTIASIPEEVFEQHIQELKESNHES